MSVKTPFDEAFAAFTSRRYSTAESICRAIIAAQPDHADAFHLLAGIAHQVGKNEIALDLVERAITLRSQIPEYHNTRGAILEALKRTDVAAEAYQRATRLNPNFAAAHSNLGGALTELGLLSEAIESYRRALALAPDNAGFHSNLIYALHFHPAYDAQRLASEAARWNSLHGTPLAYDRLRRTMNPIRGRRINLGYLSSDLRDHAVSFFLLPVLQCHDRDRFAVHCYSNSQAPDAVTERFRALTDQWHDVAGLDDSGLAELVARDGIDILVDLTMHTAGNRLPALASKSAPIQMSWLAYPGSTGLEAIDYRITDSHIEPPSQANYSTHELPLRLPDAWCCYLPFENCPEVSELPALNSGGITFGSMNKLAKVSEPLLDNWARLLSSVPTSRLRMLCHTASSRDRIGRFFESHGVSRDRLTFVSYQSQDDYLKSFGEIDVCLDSFPCNGMTTTCHALWMGVPVVSLAGETAVSRAGASLLHTVGLPELVATSADDYLRIASELAGDLRKLGELRLGLRSRVATSALMDAPRFTRNLEAAFASVCAA